MKIDGEKAIDFYYGDYRKGGLLSKRFPIKVLLYKSHIVVECFDYYKNKVSCESRTYDIPICKIQDVYISRSYPEQNIVIVYDKDSVVKKAQGKIIILGLDNYDKWFMEITKVKKDYDTEVEDYLLLVRKQQEKKMQMQKQAEEKAERFYNNCRNFHIKEDTPIYTIYEDKNQLAIIYVGENLSLNFLKIDGYNEEEYNAIIPYEKIHYFEKAGKIHYTTDIKGDYTFYGGSMTGGKFSKLAAIGGGLLFGHMGMGVGAMMTYKPMEQKPISASLKLDSDIKTIDDRNVLLNFFSDTRKQFIDIELPKETYNFLQTYIPAKKYEIVEELEKRSVFHDVENEKQRGENIKENKDDTLLKEFNSSVKKLMIMKDAGLISVEEFEEKKNQLLESI